MRHRWTIPFLLLFLLNIFSQPAMAAKSADVSTALSSTGLQPGKEATIAIIVEVKPGLHAQSHLPKDKSLIPLTLKLDPTDGVTFGEPLYPPGKDEDFPALGTVNVYTGKIIVRIPVTAIADAKPHKLTINGKVHLQACNDSSCFRPEDIPFELATEIVPTAATATTQSGLFAGPSVTGKSGTDMTIVTAFSLAFVIGIIFNAMPCVLPVVPLKIMGFYEVSQHNRAKSVALGAVFSLGLIASFGVLALLVVGLRVLNWGGLFQQTWFTLTIVTVLIVMAFSLFGIFTVNLPTTIYRFSPRHDTYTGNFLFGVLTAALSTPCTFGMFVGLLTWSLAQPAAVGVGAIMMVGVGMAFPYFILSAVPEVARNFPRTGPWSEVIKQMMAFLLLGTAVFFARPLYERFVSERAFWWTLFAVVLASAIFLVARSIQLSSTFKPRLIASIIAVAIIVPAFLVIHRLTSNPYDWQKYSDTSLAASIANGDTVLVDFTATWCNNCHFIEGFVLGDPKVIKELKAHHVVMVKADVTDDNAPAKPLLNKLSSAGAIPLTAMYSPNSPTPKLLDGIYSANDLLKLLDEATRS